MIQPQPVRQTVGPSHWHESYPIAIEGLRQSPIDISTVEAETDVGLGEKKLTWKYLRNGLKDMENTGASWKVNVDGSGSGVTTFAQLIASTCPMQVV